jgi:hypothetical protein
VGSSIFQMADIWVLGTGNSWQYLWPRGNSGAQQARLFGAYIIIFAFFWILLLHKIWITATCWGVIIDDYADLIYNEEYEATTREDEIQRFRDDLKDDDDEDIQILFMKFPRPDWLNSKRRYGNHWERYATTVLISYIYKLSLLTAVNGSTEFFFIYFYHFRRG